MNMRRKIVTENDLKLQRALDSCTFVFTQLTDPSATKHRLVINTPSEYAALRLVDQHTPDLALQAKLYGAAEAHIYYDGCKGRPFVIPVCMAPPTEDLDPDLFPATEMTPVHNLLLGADYCRMHEFLMEQRQQGKIVIITSNTSDICYHTNDLLNQTRGKRKPHEWTGYCYLWSWRADRASRPIDGINPQYERLKSLLERDGYVPSYEYELFRPDVKENRALDSWVTYKTDYYLCNDYLGDQVRIGVSHPDDYSVLEQPTGAIAGR